MIDSHVHFWQLERGDYTWISEKRPILNQDFLPDDFENIISQTDVSRCMAVQAAATEAETYFLLEQADIHDCIAGVVGWIDLTTDTVKQDIQRFSKQPKLKGIRPMAGMTRGKEWLGTQEYEQGFKALADEGLILEALALAHHLDGIATIACAHTELSIVINHAAKPTPAEFSTWAVDVQQFANLPNVYCKVSGLSQQSMDIGHQSFVVDTLLEVFGAQRLIWGSDFPVLLETSQDYPNWIARTESLLNGLSRLEKEQITKLTAQALYQL